MGLLKHFRTYRLFIAKWLLIYLQRKVKSLSYLINFLSVLVKFTSQKDSSVQMMIPMMLWFSSSSMFVLWSMIISQAHHQKIISIACSPEVETETENFFRCDNYLLSFPDLHKLSHPLQVFRDAKRQENNLWNILFSRLLAASWLATWLGWWRPASLFTGSWMEIWWVKNLELSISYHNCL